MFSIERWLCVLVLISFLCPPVFSSLRPEGLTVESQVNPSGIDTPAPRLSWLSIVETGEGSEQKDGRIDGQKVFNQYQTAYQVQVAGSIDDLETSPDLWDSGRVESSQSLFVPYSGKPLTSSQFCWWRVRVWDQSGQVGSWSAPGRWITGVMTPGDWKGQWISTPASTRPDVDLTGAKWIAAPDRSSNTVFAKAFDLTPLPDGEVRFVALRLAGDREYEVFVNGKKAAFTSGFVFKPQLLRLFDISNLVQTGTNIIVFKIRNQAGKTATALAKIEIYRQPAGTDYNPLSPPVPTAVILSDTSWTIGESKSAEPKPADAGPNVMALYDPDGGPWGKVLRRTENIQPAFEKVIDVPAGKSVISAVLHLCGLGNSFTTINGQPINKELLSPAPTRYDRRVMYTTTDITELIKSQQRNVLHVELGHSWYDMRTVATWNFDASPWRDFPRMIAQIAIRYEDGSTETIASDASWKYYQPKHLYDCIRQGEIIDSRLENRVLGNATVVEAPQGKLAAERCTGTKPASNTPVASLAPKAVYEPNPGTYVIDFGQNLAGRVRLAIPNAKPGDTIRLRYSERISADKSIERGNIACFYMEGSPAWYVGEEGQFQTDWYICNGKDDLFESRFVYHGFQYVEITGLSTTGLSTSGLSTKPDEWEIEAQPLFTDMPFIGQFESSSPLLNQIQSATQWSYISNFVNGVPTDCPHREKNGWTGDAQLAAELAQFNFENTPAYRKWIDDLTDEQRPDGNLPGIVPSGGWGYDWGNGPAWDSALVIIPWTIWCYRGDRGILEQNYPAMKRYVDYMTTRADADGLVRFGLSDWCPAKTATQAVVTSSGYYYLNAKIVARTAEILGLSDDAKKYSDLAAKIQADYNRVLYKGDGVYNIGSQCAQSCPLHQGMANGLPKDQQKLVFDKLTAAVATADNHLDVGILGMKYLLRTLSDGGRTDLALKIMLQQTRPCYGDWLARGGNTLWEDFGNGSSRNHIMFGDVSAWFFQYLGGIRLAGENPAVVAEIAPPAPAFKRFLIAPQCRVRDISPDGCDPLTFVKTKFDSPYGTIVSHWCWNETFTQLTLICRVPVNTTAEIIVPTEPGQMITVAEGTPRELAPGKYEAGSGEYTFIVK